MAKTRVYELARELGFDSKDVLARAQELDIEVKTASSGLDEDAVALVKLSYEEQPEDSRQKTEEAPDETTDEAPAEDTAVPGVVEESEPDGTPDGEEEMVLLVEPGITVHDLARLIKVRTAEIVKTLMFMGEMVPGGGEIPVEAIEPLGRELGW